MSAPALLAPGTLLRGRYRIVGEIGRGGYSIVYRAEDGEVGGDVAVKLLVPPPAVAQLARERLRREVQAVRGLAHPNIVAVYDLLDEGPWSFIVMEYVAGGDLHRRVDTRGPLAPEEAARAGRDIAAALAAAHRRGILHRDVKPQNILLESDGRARLTDFGSARLEGQAGITATGGLAGTLAYTAPEVLAGRRGDARADLYALGLTLYYALTGELPGRPALQQPPVPAAGGFSPSALAASCPGWLDGVVARATAARVEERYPTALALHEALAPGGPGGVMPPAVPRCILCEGSDPLGTGLCPACGGAPAGAADVYIFLERARGREPRRVLAARLTELLPQAAGDGGAVEQGERPLFRVTREGTARVLDALGRRDLPAVAVHRSRVWGRVPGLYVGMMAAVGVAGIAAGAVAQPVLLWTTPLMAGLLLAAAGRRLRSPLVVPGPGGRELPAALEARVVRTLAELPAGAGRNLLADIARLARPLFGRLSRLGDERGSGPVLEEMVGAACVAAADLAMLDDGLARFEAERAHAAASGAGWLEGLGRSERARDALVQRLLECIAVLARLQSQAAAAVAAEDGALAAAAGELRSEAQAQAAAAREIAQLLGETS